MTWLTNPYRFGVAGPPPAVAALSWRVRWLAAAAGEARIDTVAMATSPGGATICTGGTAIASGGTPSTAFGAGLWAHGSGSSENIYYGQWVGYRFASAVLPYEVRLTTDSTAGNALCAPRAYAVESSNDEVTWTPVCIGYHQAAWTTVETHTLVLSPTVLVDDISAAVGWRLRIDSVGSSWVTARDLEMAITASGANACTGGAAFSSSSYDPNDSFAAYKAFDGNTATEWTSEGTYAVNSFIGYWRPTPFLPVELRYTPAGVANERPTGFTVQWSSDTITWHDHSTKSGLTTGWTTNVPRVFALP